MWEQIAITPQLFGTSRVWQSGPWLLREAGRCVLVDYAGRVTRAPDEWPIEAVAMFIDERGRAPHASDAAT
jgi:hypothetical protein